MSYSTARRRSCRIRKRVDGPSAYRILYGRKEQAERFCIIDLSSPYAIGSILHAKACGRIQTTTRSHPGDPSASESAISERPKKSKFHETNPQAIRYSVRAKEESVAREDVSAVLAAVSYIEGRLSSVLSLDSVASGVGRSKFHLHRLFSKTVGITMHDYMRRRQLTEAARLLVFSSRPILDIAIGSGYESQQAFSSVFKELYKKSPNRFRKDGFFYPLQLRFRPIPQARAIGVDKEPARDIVRAALEDVPEWMRLVKVVVDGFPRLDADEYQDRLLDAIGRGRALVLRGTGIAIGAMIFSPDAGSIDFFAVHPQYRNGGAARAFLSRIESDSPKGPDISITTFREGDKADTGHRDAVKRLGFSEAELLVEYGYPTQRFVLQRDRILEIRA